MQPKLPYISLFTLYILDHTLIFMQVPKQQYKPYRTDHHKMYTIMALVFLFINIRSILTHKLLFEHLLLEEDAHAIFAK